MDSSFVVVANRLPVDAVDTMDGRAWRRSPGGLVTALHPVLVEQRGTWVGWSGAVSPGLDALPGHGAATGPGDENGADGVPSGRESFDVDGIQLVPVDLSPRRRSRCFYEGFSNGTLWPLYHDAVRTARLRTRWWEAYVEVNQRFAEQRPVAAGPGATVWVHDYQLQLVPAMLRALRPDMRIGFFLHIPFPPQELFMQLPWRRRDR